MAISTATIGPLTLTTINRACSLCTATLLTSVPQTQVLSHRAARTMAEGHLEARTLCVVYLRITRQHNDRTAKNVHRPVESLLSSAAGLPLSLTTRYVANHTFKPQD
ncbi:hypothetical protein BDR03DRAFT_955856 [Suillus americanus]|nr:hypothetical protein BDR03DRAFT_955856 [Suillus americanus]